MKSIIGTVLICATSFTANAGEVYTAIGLPGLSIGYSVPATDSVSVRGDISTLGTPKQHRTIGAVDYDVKVKVDRLAFFADWFVAGGFRATAGLTFTDARADLNGHGNGGTILLGSTSYPAGPDDRFVGQVTYPHTMPYLGVGYGHAFESGKGWGFVFDLGLAFGKPKVTGSASGPLLSQSVSQQDTQQEVDRIRNKLAAVHGIPQLSLGATYAF